VSAIAVRRDRHQAKHTRRRSRAQGLEDLVWAEFWPRSDICSRIRELKEANSAEVIALEISSRNSRIRALQKRWDRLRAGLDRLLDERGADMAGLPGGSTGLLLRKYKGKKADRLVTRIDPAIISLVAELLRHERQAAQEVGQWKTGVKEPKLPDASPATFTLAQICTPEELEAIERRASALRRELELGQQAPA
jgi:hypothetical protein